MCLYSKLVDNPKYKANKKNGGVIPAVRDIRHKYVPISCGQCIECCKRKARDWKVRLSIEIKHQPACSMVTLTFSPDSLYELMIEIQNIDKENGIIPRIGYDMDNAICTLAVRKFYERWRKEHKKTLRHWLITELGHDNTEHVHLHGIVWSKDLDKIEKHWKHVS